MRVRVKFYFDRMGFYCYKVDDLFWEVGISVLIFIIVKIFEFLGERVELKDDEIVILMFWEEVVEVIFCFGEVLVEIVF